jgi:hypothetical protein
LAEFTLEERKAWNESSGFDDFFDEAVPLPEK